MLIAQPQAKSSLPASQRKYEILFASFSSFLYLLEKREIENNIIVFNVWMSIAPPTQQSIDKEI